MWAGPNSFLLTYRKKQKALAYKRHFSRIACSGELSCHVLRTLENPYGEDHVVRNPGPANNPRGLACRVTELPRKEGDASSSVGCLGCNLLGDLEPEPPCSVVPGFLTSETV